MSLMTQDDDMDQKPVVWIVLGAVILAVVALVLGVGMSRAGVFSHGKKAASVQATASAAASSPVALRNDEAAVQVVDGVVQFYFAVGKADLAQGAQAALADAVAAAKSGKKLVVSGYHDSTGSAKLNEELAKKRAFAVRDALRAQGVAESSIELKKPASTPHTQGSDAQARRVDVAVQH